uniref:Uncharacterized protein n=1 Tax=Lepeophtheirus salmonis TaxID=72036 RepID=A0A0K2VD23_LEPSM
MKLSKVYWVY